MAADLELTLSDYWSIVRKRIAVSIFTFLTTMGVFVAYAFLKTPIYRAETIIKFDLPVGTAEGMAMPMLALAPAIQTQVNLLNSMDMAERLSKKIGCDIETARKLYQANKMGQSSLILISADDPDPARAAQLANAVAELSIAWDLEMRSRQTRKTLEEITIKKAGVEKELYLLAGKKKNFLEEHEGTGLTAALATQLLELESRRKELLRKFTTLHPDVQKLDARIRLTRQRLNVMPGEQRELEEIERDFRVCNETFIILSRQVEESKVALDSTLSFVTVVSSATPPQRPNRPRRLFCYMAGLLLGGFLAIFIAFVLENLDISITTIEEIEKVLMAPVLGIIPDFSEKAKWPSFWIWLMRKHRHEDDAFRRFLIFHHQAKSPAIEVYHSLRVNIQAQLQSVKGNVALTFTSTGVAEGKTLTAINFCMAAAHSGLKTLLVGADIRRPSLHRVFGVPKTPGLIEVLTGRATWREAVRGTVDFLMGEGDLEKLSSFGGIDDFKLMTGWASATSEIVNLFSSQRLPKLIAELRENFDIVVFDCPPVLLFVDAMLIGKHCDGVVLVYRSGKMSRRALRRAKDQIGVSQGKIVGVVLNMAHAVDMGPGYGSYYDYGHYAKPPVDGEA